MFLIRSFLISSISSLALVSAFSSSFPAFVLTSNKNSHTFMNSVEPSSSNSNNQYDSKPKFVHVNSSDIEAVHQQFEKDRKRPITQTNTAFLSTAFLGVPLFLSLLPITIVYQVGKSILPLSSYDPKSDPSIASSDESTGEDFPDENSIKPKEARKYDVVVLGGTGFTGRLIAIHIAKTYNVNKQVKWAIAGRSQSKLNKLKEELIDLIPDANDLDTIIVDTNIPSSMHGLVNDTRVVISSAGPFWKYGSKVVEFCVKYGTDYVDTTGETGWNREMMMKWNSLAIKTGSKIISLCGCDSIPWDLTFYKLSQLVNKSNNSDDGNGDHLVKVQFFDELKGGISGGTIDTMLSIGIDQKYKEQRYEFDPYYQSIDGKKLNHKTKDTSPMMPKPSLKGDGKWTIPWLMAVINYDVVKRSNALLHSETDDEVQKNLLYEEYWVQPSFKDAFVSWFGTIVSATALLNPISGVVMRKYILPKPGQGPDDKSMKKGYMLLTALGESKKGKKVESCFYFPNDPGYADTARMAAESGLCLALDADKLPQQGGGFYTPSIGMGDALLERLCMTGCKFASRFIGTTSNGELKSKL